MFYFPGCAPDLHQVSHEERGFPIRKSSGVTVVWHLTEAYRRHTASFIACESLGIHHTLFTIPVRNSGNHNVFYLSLSVMLVLIAEFKHYVCASLHMFDVRKDPILYWDTKLRERNDAVAYAPPLPTYHRSVVRMHLRDM